MTSILGLSATLSPPILALLRITPLLSTTASMTHAYMELVTTSAFLSPARTTSSLSKSMLGSYVPTSSPVNASSVADAKEVAAPVWFVNFFNAGVWSVVGLNSITLVSAAANLWLYPNGLGRSRVYYLTGLVAGFAHYVFVPLVAPSVERLFKLCAAAEKGEKASGEGKTAVESVREWAGVHKIRMSTVDVVAWVSFMVGVLGVLDH